MIFAQQVWEYFWNIYLDLYFGNIWQIRNYSEIVINKFEFLDKAFPTWPLSPNEFGLNTVPTEHQQTLAVG